MTFSIGLFATVLGAFVGGTVAASRHVSPWRLFGAACIPAAAILVVAQAEIGRGCDTTDHSVLPGWVVAALVVASLTLYGAAAVDGFAGGYRQARAAVRGPAFASAILCPLLSAAGVLLVLFELLSAALHCD